MIKSYIIELESRVKTLQQLIGDVAAYESQSKICKDKMEEISGKISNNKDLQRKYQKLNNFVEKHADALDGMYTVDKVNIVVDELDTLSETSQILNKIEKLLPCLNTQEYSKNSHQFSNLDSLRTASSVKLSQQNVIQISRYNPTPLQSIQEQERKQMNAIMQLNYRMINNLNEKIKLAYLNKIKK